MALAEVEQAEGTGYDISARPAQSDYMSEGQLEQAEERAEAEPRRRKGAGAESFTVAPARQALGASSAHTAARVRRNSCRAPPHMTGVLKRRWVAG